MMNAELKAKWVADLRNPENKQARHELCDGSAHCCLGRLYEVVGVKPTPQDEGVFSYNGEVYFPKYADLDTWGLEYETASHLADLNDEGKTFAEIADHIESNKDI